MNKSILVVDDEEAMLLIIANFLKLKGFTVFTASEGREALLRIPFNRPDLILLDVDMPKMNGFEVLEKLKSDKKNRTIPVFMLTGRDDQKAVSQGIAGLADKYFIKPVDFDCLLFEIQETFKIFDTGGIKDSGDPGESSESPEEP